MFNQKTILITGGTGSFGQKAAKYLISNYRSAKIIIFSRDEMKQWQMNLKFKQNKRLKYIIGDVRDRERLSFALDNVDYCIHAAATKIVPTAEINPSECIKTNVIGAMNVIDACIEKKVKKVIALSTDKACSPVNLYGASKLASDKLFTSSSINEYKSKSKFSVVRYGNVMGSRGSVIPFFLDKLDNNEQLPITSEKMTRFMITLEDAVKFVMFSLKDMKGGEIYVKKIPSIKIIDIAKAIKKDVKYKIIGIRPGEKIHEQMISEDDAMYTYEFKDYFIINSSNLKRKYMIGKKVHLGFQYSSDKNSNWLKADELNYWIKQNKKTFLKTIE